jgi:penicillin-binding protein 2
VYYPKTFYHTTTGETLFKNYPKNGIPLAGKTGTAQGAASKPWFDSSVFAAFSTDPVHPYTVVSYLEKAGYGAKAAGPVVKCMFEALGGNVAVDDVVLSDPLDQSSVLAAQPNLLADGSCLNNPYDTPSVRD